MGLSSSAMGQEALYHRALVSWLQDMSDEKPGVVWSHTLEGAAKVSPATMLDSLLVSRSLKDNRAREWGA